MIAAALAPLAHIGNVPVQEWLPFVVPIVALYLYGRRRERRRRREVAKIPETSSDLDPAVSERIATGWRDAKYEHVTREHLPLLYPPGPDGSSVAELAIRTGRDEETVQRLLEGLEEGEYLFLDLEAGSDQLVVSLTVKGFGLVDTTEDFLLTALRESVGSSAGT
ncbi:MAG: hypothetical protein QOK19_465 [Solirubrobacteraceae bacterium]|jgi:hypothetical protein|nr:hypothetical protein [Solirubrobacteraceae bacterium]